MPKYKFNCYESRTLTLVVEAPSLEAAERRTERPTRRSSTGTIPNSNGGSTALPGQTKATTSVMLTT